MMQARYLLLVISVVMLQTTLAFLPSHLSPGRSLSSSSLQHDDNNEQENFDEAIIDKKSFSWSASTSTRRRLLQDAGRVGLATALGLFGLPALSGLNIENVHAALFDGPIVVLGARGKTGRLIVRGLLEEDKKVKAVSHQAFTYDPKEIEGVKGKLEYALGDVTKPETLGPAISGASAVIFASSASKKGGNAQAVDRDGVENIAKAAIEQKIPRLVIISSGAVSRPDSIGYKITNIFGNIMDFKFQGENRLRALYASAPRGVTYTIVRPGGLSNDKGLGPGGLELNQKDTIIGEISRADVALARIKALDALDAEDATVERNRLLTHLFTYLRYIGEISRADVALACIKALDASDAEDATFEIYEIRRRTALQNNFPLTSGCEHRGEDWPSLFKGLKKDKDLV